MLKLALNMSMHISDDEQSINKLWPYDKTKNKTKASLYSCGDLCHTY